MFQWFFPGKVKKERRLSLESFWFLISDNLPLFFLPSPKKTKQSSTRNPQTHNTGSSNRSLFPPEIHRKLPRYVGICGQGPSDHPDLAKWLMEQGIDSVSLNPDSVSRSPRAFCVLLFVSFVAFFVFFRMNIFRYTSRCCGFFRNHVPLMYKQNPCKILPKPCKIHGYIIYHPIQNQALTLTVSFSHYTSTKFRFITVYGSQWPLGFSSTLQGDPDLAILGQVSNVHTSWSWRMKPLHLKSWKNPPAICEGRFRQVGWTLESLHLKKTKCKKAFFLKWYIIQYFLVNSESTLFFLGGCDFGGEIPSTSTTSNQPRPFEEFTRKSAQRRMQSIQVFGPFLGTLISLDSFPDGMIFILSASLESGQFGEPFWVFRTALFGSPTGGPPQPLLKSQHFFLIHFKDKVAR